VPVQFRDEFVSLKPVFARVNPLLCRWPLRGLLSTM